MDLVAARTANAVHRVTAVCPVSAAPGISTLLLCRFYQPIISAQDLLQLGVRKSVDFRVVNAFHRFRGDEGVDD